MAAVLGGALRALFIAGTLIFSIAQTERTTTEEIVQDEETPTGETMQNEGTPRGDTMHNERTRIKGILKNIYLKSDGYAKRRCHNRSWKVWALRLMLIDLDLLMQVSDIINTWNDTELLNWNENLLGSFNAIAVAGSVLASVDITALSLDSVSDLHWSARAAFSVSLLTGVLSVVFGIRVQRQLYLIGGSRQLRQWLSNGQFEYDGDSQSSIAAIRVLQLPVELLTVSWITFIAGLILYMSFMWRLHSDPGGVDYRNILICILLVLLILVGYYELMGAVKIIEQGEAPDLGAPPGTKAEPPKIGDKEFEARMQIDYGDALQAAAAGGHQPIVKLLIESGAKVNAQGGQYGNALQAALAEGHKEVAMMLLDAGADVNAQGILYGTALEASSYRGYKHLVKRLLKGGADVKAQDGQYRSALQAALQAASSGGHGMVVKLLIDTIAKVDAHELATKDSSG